jgi:hypothetical protein
MLLPRVISHFIPRRQVGVRATTAALILASTTIATNDASASDGVSGLAETNPLAEIAYKAAQPQVVDIPNHSTTWWTQLAILGGHNGFNQQLKVIPDGPTHAGSSL